MILKKFNCDKSEGTMQIKFSKAEVGIKGILAECDYQMINEDDYKISIYLGVDFSEIFEPYKEIRIKSIYSNLDKEVKKYFQSELEKGTSVEIVNFIKNIVKPICIESYNCVGKIYKIVDLKGNSYHIEEYNDYIDCYIENKENRQYVKRFDNKNDVCKFISDLCGYV